jgi:hypothetical protein
MLPLVAPMDKVCGALSQQLCDLRALDLTFAPQSRTLNNGQQVLLRALEVLVHK